MARSDFDAELKCLGCMAAAKRVAASSTMAEGGSAEQGGDDPCAGSANPFGLIRDGSKAAVAARVACAQAELWLHSGVARNMCEHAEQCCVRERARLGVPATVLESQLPALAAHSRRVCWRARLLFRYLAVHPREQGVRHCVWY